MSMLRSMFGPSRDEVWRQLAKVIGARFEDRGFWKGGSRVVAEVDPWTVTLDVYTVSTGETSQSYTRLRAPFVNADGFRFSLRPQHFFDGIGMVLGLQDVEIGHRDFDDAFVVKAKDVYQVKRLLGQPGLRERMMADPRFSLAVRDDEGWFGAQFPRGVDELVLTTNGVVTDLPRLKGLFDLFAETLHALCHIGSAYENDPGLTL